MVKFDAYVIDGQDLDIQPAPVEREWMEQTDQRFAYRCLPLNIANGHGWEIRCPAGFSARWSGEKTREAIRIEGDDGAAAPAVTHFGHGVLTFHVSAIFRTEPGYDLMVQGPINRPKDGIYALSGIVETDWMPFTFTMNWAFTREGARIRFEKNEPFCHLFPVRRGEIEAIEPQLRPLSSDEELTSQYETWSAGRSGFLVNLNDRDPAALKEGWQKHYYKGADAAGITQNVDGHRTRMRVRPFQKVE